MLCWTGKSPLLGIHALVHRLYYGIGVLLTLSRIATCMFNRLGAHLRLSRVTLAVGWANPY